jgi:hypothetical protein
MIDLFALFSDPRTRSLRGCLESVRQLLEKGARGFNFFDPEIHPQKKESVFLSFFLCFACFCGGNVSVCDGYLNF